MDLSRRNVLLLLFSLAGAHTSWAATLELPLAHENLFDMTKDLFAILLEGPAGGINALVPGQLHKLFHAVTDVTLAALKADQTARLSSISIDEEQTKKNIYFALLAGDGRLAREMMGKLVAFHVLGPGGEGPAKGSAALRQFFVYLGYKQVGSSLGRFAEAVVQTFGAPRLASLAFAIDTTASMFRDMSIALFLIADIATTTEDAASSYVLAPFNDPVVPPAQRFNADVPGTKGLLSMAAKLTPKGGGDCPEPVMQGILNALQLVDWFSTIIVITDAPALDKVRKQEVIDAAQLKLTTINFFDKQHCGFQADHAVYEEIADALGGHVMRYISQGWETALVDMVWILSTSTGSAIGDVPPGTVGGTTGVTIPVDTTVTDMKIVASTFSVDAISMKVYGPFPTFSAYTSISRSFATFLLKDPPPGNYHLTVEPADCRYTVYLESTFYFEYSFWAISLSNIYLVDTPTKGNMAHILVHIASSIEHLSTWCSRLVQFLSIGAEEVLSNYNLVQAGSTGRSMTAYVQIPTTPFRLRFVTCQATGYQVIRRTTLAIYPNDHAVQLVLVGSQTISTGVVRATFALSNFGTVSGTYSLQVLNPPAGTSATVSSLSLVVDAETSKQFQVTFTVGGSTIASPQFTVQATVGAAVVARYKYTYLDNARLAWVRCTYVSWTVKPGGDSNGRCQVMNLGPGEGDFTFTVSGGPPGYSATVSPTKITNLNEFLQVSVNVAVSAPSHAPVNTRAVFQVTTKSGRLEAGSANIAFKVQAREIETAPITCFPGCPPPYFCVGPDTCGM